jgi:protein-S-isoprenylcysteine O-methyltransferase Ste14
MSPSTTARRKPRSKGAPVLAIIPPPIWALFYVIAVFLLDQAGLLPTAAPLYEPLLGALFILGGIALAVAANIEFRKAGTALAPTARVNSELVTDGIYARTRNPMYLGLVLITLGLAFIQGALPWFIVPVLVFLTNNFVVVPYEEAKMHRQFGAMYEAYRRKVRRWI